MFSEKMSEKNLVKKNCQKSYIKSLCAKLFRIFSNIYFGTNILEKLNKHFFELYQVFMYDFL